MKGRKRRRGRGSERERERGMVDHYVFLTRTATPPIIGYDSTTATNVYLREGESVQFCVMLVSGSIPFEFTFQVLINRNFEQPRESKSRLLLQLLVLHSSHVRMCTSYKHVWYQCSLVPAYLLCAHFSRCH